MNPHIHLDHTPILKQSSLPKTGGGYALVLLSGQHIDQILSLQDTVFDTLSAEEQGFLLKKNRAFFENHFSNGNAVLGIVHGGHLIAQSIIVHPTSKNPKTGMVDMTLNAPTDKITLLQGIIVHPDYQGNRLMTVMVDAWLTLAKEQRRTHALAEVAVGNVYSWSVFLREGLHIHSLGRDTADGTQVYNIHARVAPLIQKRLRPDFNKASSKRSVQCPQVDLERQRKILANGYRGVKFNAADGSIEFQPFKRKPRAPGAG